MAFQPFVRFPWAPVFGFRTLVSRRFSSTPSPSVALSALTDVLGHVFCWVAATVFAIVAVVSCFSRSVGILLLLVSFVVGFIPPFAVAFSPCFHLESAPDSPVGCVVVSPMLRRPSVLGTLAYVFVHLRPVALRFSPCLFSGRGASRVVLFWGWFPFVSLRLC